MLCHGGQGNHMGKHQGLSGGRGRGGQTWVRAFIMVSLGKNRQGRVSRLRTGQFE